MDLPRESVRSREPRDEVLEAGLVTRVFGNELGEGVFEPKAREDTRSSMTCEERESGCVDNRRARVARTWTDDVEHVQALLRDEAVKMGVDDNETWARSPGAKVTRLKVFRRNRALEEDVVFQEDHG